MNLRITLHAAYAALALCGTDAMAEAPWLAPAGKLLEVKAGQADVPVTPRFASPLEAMQASLDDKPSPVADDTLSLPAVRTGDARLSARRISADGEPVIYLARFGRDETQVRQALELVPTKAGGNRFVPVWQGRVVPASKVLVSTSAGWRRTLLPAENGSVTLSTPFAGVDLMEVAARATGASGTVTVDDPRYANARYVATLSFEVDR